MEHKNFEGKEQAHSGWLLEVVDTYIDHANVQEVRCLLCVQTGGGRIPEGSVKGFALS